MIPVPMFEPDKSPFLFQAGDNLVNCIPKADGVGPMPKLVEVSVALPAECRGAVSIKEPDGTIAIYAGTVDNLYKLNTTVSPFGWSEISKTTGAYSLNAGERWDFEYFGKYLIATQDGNPPQYLDVETANDFADLSGAPSTAKRVWRAGDFLTLGWVDGEPDKIQWSAINDPLTWTNGVGSSDFQFLASAGGIQAGLGDQRGAIIFQRDEMRFMQFNQQYIFTISEANTTRGIMSPFSAVQIGPSDFVYLSEDGFYRGVDGVPIGGERVNRWFRENCDPNYFTDVRGVADPLEKIVWWRFQNNAGEGILLGWDWQLDRWCYSDQDNQHLFSSITVGTAWDALDDLYATIDDVDAPYDSRLFQGGRPTFAAFTTDNKLAYFTGVNLETKIQTAQVQLIPNSRAFVNGCRFVSDATNFTMQVGANDYHQPTITLGTAASPNSRNYSVPFRSDGRLHSFCTTIPEAATWSIASGFEPEDAVPSGKL